MDYYIKLLKKKQQNSYIIKLLKKYNNDQKDKNKLKTKLSLEKFKKSVEWAINKQIEPKKTENMTKTQHKEILKNKEKCWGNEIIDTKDNGQWTTKLGEYLVHDTLSYMGKNPRRVKKLNGFLPDWETDDAIYEVKTSNYYVDGTAGEKVLGTFIKYQDIPTLYNKPLYIVCVANQEYELTQGKTCYFGNNIKDKTKEVLKLANKWQIKYIKFSDLIKNININQL